MEKYFTALTTDISYNDDIFEVDLNELATERSKKGSLYWELLAIIKNLSIGMDLTRIQAPLYIVKPISFIEMYSQYVQPTEKVLTVGTEKDAPKRMLLITEYLVSSFFETIKEVFLSLFKFLRLITWENLTILFSEKFLVVNGNMKIPLHNSLVSKFHIILQSQHLI
jgi:hypothetical protein